MDAFDTCQQDIRTPNLSVKDYKKAVRTIKPSVNFTGAIKRENGKREQCRMFCVKRSTL